MIVNRFVYGKKRNTRSSRAGSRLFPLEKGAKGLRLQVAFTTDKNAYALMPREHLTLFFKLVYTINCYTVNIIPGFFL